MKHSITLWHCAKSPCKASLTRSRRSLCGILRRLEASLIESVWVETVLEHCFPSEENTVATDGKTLRESKKQGARCFQLLAVLGHRLGVCLHQRAIPGDGEDKSHEITTLQTLLDDLFHQSPLTRSRLSLPDALSLS